MFESMECNNMPDKYGSPCEDCTSGTQNPDTGIGKNDRIQMHMCAEYRKWHIRSNLKLI